MSETAGQSARGHSAIGGGKSPALVLAVLAVFILLLAVLGPCILRLPLSADGPFEFMCLSAFCCLMVLFWLLGAYYLSLSAVFIADHIRLRRKPRETDPQGLDEAPRVAILYPTCDDFQRDALCSCIAQRYPNFHVFILDDSREARFMEMSNRFAREHPTMVTVIRRGSRTGFKAGNLNHALRIVGEEFPYFAVMDADELLPDDFLGRMTARVVEGCHAFVQACHVPNPGQTQRFARELGQTILPFWRLLLSVKNRYGCVACVGHGMLVRTSAWRAVGGFPEVASEDLAFTAVLLESGMRGYYDETTVCKEDFPATLQAFKKQQERYTAGVAQVMIDHFPGVLRSRKASWIEKADFILCCLPLYVPVLCLLFLLLNAVALPAAFGKFSQVVASTYWGIVEIPFLQTFDGRFEAMWSPMFVWISVALSIAPAMPMLMLALMGRIRNPFRLLVTSNVMYMATSIPTTIGLIRFLVKKSIHFLPTGYSGRDGSEGRFRHRLPGTFVEMASAVALAAVLVLTLNPGLAVVALCPVLAKVSTARHCLLMNWTASFAFAAILGQMLLGAVCSYAPRGFVPLIFSMHF